MNQQTYVMHDQNPKGMIRIKQNEAKEWNEKGYGVFTTVNDFSGERRIEKLRRVNAFAVDIDSGSKDEMAKKIRSGLTPSLVVETKRGYHVWWVAKNAQPEYWDAIVLDRLVPFYGADRNARDLCRVLRVPGFMHLKNPTEPFLIKKVFEHHVSYSQEQIAKFYPDKSAPERNDFINKAKKESEFSQSFWENVWRLDCMYALDILSGSEFVGSEKFTFKKNSNGKYNIFVNGKGTSCFVDESMRIGSLSKGGPTIYNWLCWYGHTKRKSVEIIQTLFPETKEVKIGTTKI